MIIVLNQSGGGVVDEVPEDLPTRPPLEPRRGVLVTMTGSDGSVWDLTNGPVRVQTGVKWGYADPEAWDRESPGLDGAQRVGMRTPASEPSVPVQVGYGVKTSLEWRDVDAAFSKALDASVGPVQFTVVTPDALARTLTCYYQSGLDADTEIDPLNIRHAFYDLEFKALDPYWRTEPAVVVFGVAEEVSMFPAAVTVLADALLHIGAANSTSTATVNNVGDIAAWPKWTITGPYDSATIGVGDNRVVFTSPIGAGQVRVIDTAPSVRSFDENGVDGDNLWLEASDVDFAAIPAGQAVELSIDVVGGDDEDTTITLEFTPGYRKQW